MGSLKRGRRSGKRNLVKQQQQSKLQQQQKKKQSPSSSPTSSTRSTSSKNTTTKAPTPRPPKNYMQKLPKQPPAIPPALLAPTGSPYVYINRTVLNDDLDPSRLFADPCIPRLFLQNEFMYIPPKVFNFEYPKSKNANANAKNKTTPEVAVLGRSNVGKSSLVNALMRRNLCVTSKSPGRTQQAYYHGLFDKTVPEADRVLAHDAHAYLIDLPGYGYGSAPKGIVEGWQSATQECLLNRRDAGVLRRLFLLLDARRDEGPSELDRTVVQWLEDANIPYSIVLTKADRTSSPRIVKQVNDLCLRYASRQALEEDGTSQSPVIHVTSSQQNWGVSELLHSIEAEFLADDEGDDDEDEYHDEEEDDDDDDEEEDDLSTK
jgi:GTP-binding protein